MSVPPRTKASSEVRPVFGAVIVCLAQCLRLNGFFDGEQDIPGTEFDRLGEAFFTWAGSSSRDEFWPKLGAKGYSQQTADASAQEFGGARIGWIDQIFPQNDTCVHYPPYNRICTDVNLCLAVLSRRVDNLFLSWRPPDYTRDHLLCWAFVADDPGLAERSIAWEQWPLREQQRPPLNDNPLKHPFSRHTLSHKPNTRHL